MQSLAQWAKRGGSRISTRAKALRTLAMACESKRNVPPEAGWPDTDAINVITRERYAKSAGSGGPIFACALSVLASPCEAKVAGGVLFVASPRCRNSASSRISSFANALRMFATAWKPAHHTRQN